MEKYVSLLLALVLVLMALCSCNVLGEDPWEYKDNEKQEKEENEEEKKPETPLEIEKPVEIEGVAKLSLIRVSTESKVRGSMGGGLYYENSTAGNVYIDAVFEASSLSEENKAPDELFKAYALNGEGKKISSVLCCVEIDGNSSVSKGEAMLPLSEYRLHAAFSVPKTEKDITLCFEFEKDVYTYKYTSGNKDMIVRPLSEGDTVGGEESATLKLLGCEYTKEVKPSNTDGAYSYYNCETEGNIYLVLAFELTNYKTEGASAESFVGVRALYDGKYEYAGFVSKEKGDKKGFSTFDDIVPLECVMAVGVIEVPESLMETTFEISVMIDGTEYTVVSVKAE